MHSPELPPAIFLMGPTASGKSALALELASRRALEIISVDAAQVYCGLDIGTAKPSAEERARVRHHLIDVRDPRDVYSAADFCRDALRIMDEVTASGRIPLLVGGTMFYFRALEQGLPDLPGADPELRARLLREADLHGWTALHQRLQRLDPARAARVHPNDPQRTLRALEIILLSGRTASGYGVRGQSPLPYRVIKLALYPNDRVWLHERITARFQQMLAAGFLDEARALFARTDLAPQLPALRAVGYRQAGLYLSGKINYDQMVAEALAASRQLARRQMTWLRADPAAQRIDCSGIPDAAAAASHRLFASLPL